MALRLSLVVFLVLLLGACTSNTPTPSPTATQASPTATSIPPTATPTATPAVPTATPTPQGGNDPATIGRKFVALLSTGDFAGAEAVEDATMQSAAPAAGLQQLWQSLVTQYGAFQSIGNVTTAAQDPYVNVSVPTNLANAIVTLVVTVNASGEVSGLHVGAVAPPASATSTAPYVNPSSFTESDVTVGSAPWALPGTLTMPNGSGPFPAVVLVAGSGPSDRNETVGPNKPFEDIAWGLASQRIAVLRYDKRTFVYSQQMAQMNDITVHQETMDDAEAAVAMLRNTPKIDSSRVFVVGHSLGAHLAPRIAAEIPGELAGIAMLEAPSTPLAQLIMTQERYLASLQGTPTPQIEQQLQVLQQQVALAQSSDLSTSTPATSLPLGVPASYWLDLQTYDPTATAAGLSIPMFFSQGGRDYQVPPSELTPWQNALAGHSNVTYKTYPAMNHLLFDGSGPSTPAEYMTPNHVKAQLVADLGAWVLGQQGS